MCTLVIPSISVCLQLRPSSFQCLRCTCHDFFVLPFMISPMLAPLGRRPTVMKSICYDYLLKHKSHYVFGFSSVSSFSAHQVVGNNRKSFSEPNSFDCS